MFRNKNFRNQRSMNDNQFNARRINGMNRSQQMPNFNMNNNQQKNINNFSNLEELQKSGIQVIPYDETNKEEVLKKSVKNNNNIQGEVVFATDEFKKKYLENKEEQQKTIKKEIINKPIFDKEKQDKVKFENSDIYTNEFNRRNFYLNLLDCCDNEFRLECVKSILKNCDNTFKIYEKERLFKDKPKFEKRKINLKLNKETIRYAIREENKNYIEILNNLNNKWSNDKVNRLLVIKNYDINILNSILLDIMY